MSLLAITRPFSPEPTPYDFDQDFLDFLQTPPSYDFLELSPSPTKGTGKGDMSSNQDQAQIKTEGEREKSEDVPMAPSGLEPPAPSTTTPFRMQNLSLDENTHDNHSAIDLFGPHAYQGYNNLSSSYPTAAPSHNFHYHPYAMRDYSGAMRSRSPVSPIRPLSPPLSNSPPGSAGSHHPTLSNSPHLVSPMSTIASADTSPGSMGFHYQLPFSGTPLSTIGNLANVSPPSLSGGHAHGPGMSMVSGFPYPTLAQNPPSMPGKGGRPRVSRGATSRSTTSKRPAAHNDMDDDSDIDDGPTEGPSQGLGFSTAMEGEERIPVSNKREDIRKARIESEQGADKSKRRRDELREGFRRLKEVLPQTSQRSSKSSLLDRSVAHIQSIEAANRYLLAQLEAANRDLEKLRHTNTELVHAVATNSRGSNSPTNSGGRA